MNAGGVPNTCKSNGRITYGVMKIRNPKSEIRTSLKFFDFEFVSCFGFGASSFHIAPCVMRQWQTGEQRVGNLPQTRA